MDSFSSKSTNDLLKANAKTRGLPAHLFKGIFSPTKTESTNAMTRSTLKPSPSVPTLFLKLDPREHRGIEVTKKDITMIHATKNVDRVQSPLRRTEPSPVRRNPILQNNNEPVQEERPRIKTSGNLTRTTLFDDQKEKKKVINEKMWQSKVFSQEPLISPKVRVPPEFSSRNVFLEHEMRLATSKSPTKRARNPIIQEEQLIDDNQVRIRVYTQEDSVAKILNDRKELHLRTPSSTKGRVFKESNIDFSYNPKDDDAKPLNRLSPKAIQKKMAGRMGSLITGEYSIQQKDEGISTKINNVKFATLTKRAEAEDQHDHLVESYDF